ncbi:hemerythrin domain-containing protein [Methanobacterium sp.]|uniref:hemerythrin domain-containing protein n=1 Tax=Methanobacterium sp. TaxID=2164 RepID=UPI003C74204E
MTEDLFQMLKNDHDNVKNLLKEASDKKDSSKFREIKNQLNIHMESEEKYFYPRLKYIDEDGMNQSFKEHDEAKEIIKDMERIHWKDKEWMNKLNELRKTVEAHVEKEETTIFPESERLSNLQREEIAQNIEEEKMRKKLKSIPHEKLMPLPDNIDIPRTIPASKVKIPSMYANGDIEYEDAKGNNVDKENATHIRLTGIDRRSDIVVGPVKPKGMIRLTLYFNDENSPETKEKSTSSKSKVFNEEYKPIKK